MEGAVEVHVLPLLKQRNLWLQSKVREWQPVYSCTTRVLAQQTQKIQQTQKVLERRVIAVQKQ